MKNFLFGLSNRRIKTVWQGFSFFFCVCFLVHVVSLSSCGFVFAAAAVELQDEELDTIHAQGLSLKYDVTMRMPGNPLSPRSPSVPLQGVIHRSNINNAAIAKAIDSMKSIRSPRSPDAPSNPGLNLTANNSSGQSVQSSGNVDLYPYVLPPITVTPGESGYLGGGPVVQVDAGATQNSDPLTEVSPALGSNGPQQLTAEPDQSNVNLLPSVNPGANVVAVDDTAQQYLSSLVNVNAAGSIVPVLINIVIDMNSKVEELSNTNRIDLHTISRF
jgi:hypothetical protein